MQKLQIIADPRIDTVFKSYPKEVRKRILNLRRLILDVAQGIEQIHTLEETLKWGEPSYLVNKGSTIRIDWKPKTPNQYAMYFKCTSRLVPTFKAVFAETFSYEGDRAIIFKLDEEVPEEALKACIAAALTYHRVKHLPILGM